MAELSAEQVASIVRTVLAENEIARERREQEFMRTVLVMIGIDPNQPDELIANDLKNFRDVVAYSDKWMKSVNRIQRVGITTAVTVIVGGILGVIWLGIKTTLHLQ